MRSALVAVTCLLVVVSFPHALEDFRYGDLSRLGIHQPLGTVILCTAYALQVLGIVLTPRQRTGGPLLLAAMGAIWCVGAILIHGHDMLFAGEAYRHGLISRLLELLIIVLGSLAAVLGIRVARASGGQPAST